MRRLLGLLIVSLLGICLAGAAAPASAQFGKLKDKVKQKAAEKIEKKIEGSDEKTPAEEEQAVESEEKESAPAAAAGSGNATAEDMTLYTKYDFVPGDKVIFYDDLSRDELGEFPSRWKLDNGVFEIAKQSGRNFIMCTDRGSIRPKVAPGQLPPKYTIEVEFWYRGGGAKSHWYRIHWVDAEDEDIGNFGMQDLDDTNLRILTKDIAQKKLATPLSPGLHTMRVMATSTTMKCYIDNERVANVPATDGFVPAGFRVYMDPWKEAEDADNPMLLGTVRYAEGGKTLKQQLDEAGRIVTHGILFDSGSDKIKGESYKTLADIGALLTENPALRLSIEGHTDSDGADDSNKKLSEARSASVRTYLIENSKIDGARLESRGWGETKPIDTNDTPEGKANNRRVELVKL